MEMEYCLNFLTDGKRDLRLFVNGVQSVERKKLERKEKERYGRVESKLKSKKVSE